MNELRHAENHVKLATGGRWAYLSGQLPRTTRIDQTWKPGYIGFCHSVGVVGAAIRLDQRLSGDPDWQVNHAFILDEPISGTLYPNLIEDWWVIQAEAHGVTGSRPDGTGFHRAKLSSIAPGGYYEIVTPPSEINLTNVVGFARQEVGAEYGFFSIASLVVDELTPGFIRIDFRKDGSWICSALAAEALRTGGWLHHWPDVYQVRPSQLRAALKLTQS